MGRGEMKRHFKRVFVGSDSHCGHRAGLTPPKFQARGGFGKWEALQAELWDFYMEKLYKWKPFDIAILNGDLTDGKGQRTGGSELITADRFKQAEIAYQAFREIGAKKYRLVAGTPYHSGMEEDFEIKVNTIINTSQNIYIIQNNEEKFEYFELKFKHKNGTLYSLAEESDGTVRLIELFSVLFHNDEKVFVIDEIDRSLHPLLTYNFIE